MKNLFAIWLFIYFPAFVESRENEKTSYESFNGKRLHVTALIPARAGSKGIKDKNLSLVGNETLIARSLRVIKECGKFDSIWVSTDGKAIADEVEANGGRVHWRDPKTATDTASTVSAVEDFLLNHETSDFVAVIQCTSPFIKKEFLCDAIDSLLKSNADCLFSVTRNHQFRWIENEDGFVSPLNLNPTNRPRRQDWEGELIENGMFYFVKKEVVLNEKVLQNKRCKIFEIPKIFSLEIDTNLELLFARTINAYLNENPGLKYNK